MSTDDSDETQLSELDVQAQTNDEDHDDKNLRLGVQSSTDSSQPNTYTWKFWAQNSLDLQIHLLKQTGQVNVPFTFFKVPELGSECVPCGDTVSEMQVLTVSRLHIHNMH